MKVFLVKPREITDSMAPPLGLGYLAANLAPNHHPYIIDCILRGTSPKKLGYLAAKEKPGIVGFTLHTFEKALVSKYLIEVRAACPEAVTVVGGPHPSALPHDPFHEYGDLLDFAFCGEAESGFSKLVDLVDEHEKSIPEENLESISGLVYRHNETGEIKINQRWCPSGETIGKPRWELLNPEKYPPCPPGAFFKKYPFAPISISRGCPNPCSFCAVSSITGRKIRYRPLDSVMDEMDELHSKYGIKEFHIVDDNFTSDRNYVLSFCERVIATLPDIAWTCPNGVRSDSLDDELLDLMKRSGCYSLSVGIEAADQQTLDSIGKNLDIKQIEKTVRKISSKGISVRAFFIFGFPGQTLAQMEKTIRFAKNLPLEMALFSLFHPFPGTPIYNKLEQEGKVGQIRQSAKTLAEVAYVPKGMTTGQLKRVQRKAFLAFFFRPKTLFGLVKNIKSPEHFIYLVKRMVRWFVSR